ncbi:MAG: 50S ribosomal protein L18 [Candidatus Marinimicrobia bacterium]|nr:50S ribosomal protein L18 [Candidatus Neomarinimicrobiota bacterium]
MIKRQQKNLGLRLRRRRRGKKKFDRFDGKLRLVVTRSAKHITGQIVDDAVGKTLVAASSLEKALAGEARSATSKIALAASVGKTLGERAKAMTIDSVVFDRNGHVFHGRVKAFAEGAREGGLKI